MEENKQPEADKPAQASYSTNLTSDDILAMSPEQFGELVVRSESDPLLKAVIVRALQGKKLVEFKRISDKRNQPYYNEKTAREVQRALDFMMKEKKSI